MKSSHRNLKPIVLAGLFSVLFSIPLYAQTALRLEELLEKPDLAWSDAVIFVLEASETEINDDSTELSDPIDAFNFALEQKWLPKYIEPDDPAKLDGIALLLMRSFGMKGGLFYSISKSPHHAYRELTYKGIIRGEADPSMSVSGQQLLLMVSRLLSIKEKEAEEEAVREKAAEGKTANENEAGEEIDQ